MLAVDQKVKVNASGDKIATRFNGRIGKIIQIDTTSDLPYYVQVWESNSVAGREWYKESELIPQTNS